MFVLRSVLIHVVFQIIVLLFASLNVKGFIVSSKGLSVSTTTICIVYPRRAKTASLFIIMRLHLDLAGLLMHHLFQALKSHLDRANLCFKRRNIVSIAVSRSLSINP